jgi:hypothetical protein
MTTMADPLNPKRLTTRRYGPIRPARPLTDDELRLKLYGHGIAAGCVGILAL